MYIVVDIGGTKTRIAGSSDLKTLTEPVIYETPQKYDEGLAHLLEHARSITGAEPIEAIAIGLPVLLSSDHRSIRDSTNLPDWGGRSFADDLSSLNANSKIVNDVVLVGLGEAVFGAGKGARNVAYLTVS